jgi:hypothetical protein
MTEEPSMYSMRKDIEELQGQLRKGDIQRAYRALLSYMMGLRTHFKNNLSGSTVSGLYQGYMDMTYFALFPSSATVAFIDDIDRFLAEQTRGGVRKRRAPQARRRG